MRGPLHQLLEAYARGETHVQHEVLDEVEPLLFGMVRSLVSSGPDAHERAVAATQALVLAFHLRAAAGRLRLENANDLRAYVHRAATRKLEDEEPLPLLPLADPETGSMIYKCFGLGLTIEAELTAEETEWFVARLAGEPAAEPRGARAKLEACGILRPRPKTHNP